MPDARILVIRGGAVGDFILTLPVLAALRSNLPNARLEVLGYQHIANLAVAGGIADRVRGIEERGFATFFARNAPLPREQVEYFRTFGVIISFLYDPDEIFQENIRSCSPAQFIVGPHRPDETGTVHATDVLLKALERLAIFGAPNEPRLAVPAAAPPGPGRWLAAHPGSGSERKNWPEARWAELLGWVTNSTDWNVLLIGGEAEGKRIECLAAALPAGRVRVSLNAPLVELAAILSGCEGFIGHDSGLTHLAAAVGLPGVVLWGHTNESVWRPRCATMRILRSPAGLTGISVQKATGALGEL
jgi:heptosyltransferase-2